jgi:hypothetical protein
MAPPDAMPGTGTGAELPTVAVGVSFNQVGKFANVCQSDLQAIVR